MTARRYSRQDWKARPPRGHERLDRGAVDGIALHWPAMSTPLENVPAVMAALRSWQAYHMDTHKWSDIAYQVAIDQAGNTYRLRGLRYRSAANGSTDVNSRFGALLLVVAEGERPTNELVEATRGRIAQHRLLFPSSRLIVGHQDIRPEPTACPGPAIMRLIGAGSFNPARSHPE